MRERRNQEERKKKVPEKGEKVGREIKKRKEKEEKERKRERSWKITFGRILGKILGILKAGADQILRYYGEWLIFFS